MPNLKGDDLLWLSVCVGVARSHVTGGTICYGYRGVSVLRDLTSQGVRFVAGIGVSVGMHRKIRHHSGYDLLRASVCVCLCC